MLRPHDDVDLMRGEEFAQRSSLGIVLDPDRLEEWRRARLAVPPGGIDGAPAPAHARQIDVVVVREEGPEAERPRPGVERDANALAGDVLGRADAGVAVDVDVAVPEHPRWEHRQRHERTVAADEPADVFGTRELRSVELLLAAHAVEQVARRVDGDE